MRHPRSSDLLPVLTLIFLATTTMMLVQSLIYPTRSIKPPGNTANLQTALIGTEVAPAFALIGTPEMSSTGIGLVLGEVSTSVGSSNPTDIARYATERAALASESVDSAADPDWFTSAAGGYRIEPGLAPEWLALAASQTGTGMVYGVLQFNVPFDPAWVIKFDALSRLGVRGMLYRQQTSSTLAAIPVTALPTLAEWVKDGQLRYAGPIPIEQRIPASLWTIANTSPDVPLPIRIVLIELPTNPQPLLDILYADPLISISEYATEIQGWVDPSSLTDLAAMPPVIFVGSRETEACIIVGFDKRCTVETPPPTK